jgi:hypothetical protein
MTFRHAAVTERRSEMGTEMRVVIDDGGRCVCRAVAIATERPYQEIYDRLKALMELEGPRRRSGVEEFVQHKLMEALGWTWVSPTHKTHLREDDLPPGRLVVSISQNSVAVVDGVIHDTHDSFLGDSVYASSLARLRSAAHEPENGSCRDQYRF